MPIPDCLIFFKRINIVKISVSVIDVQGFQKFRANDVLHILFL